MRPTSWRCVLAPPVARNLEVYFLEKEHLISFRWGTTPTPLRLEKNGSQRMLVVLLIVLYSAVAKFNGKTRNFNSYDTRGLFQAL